MTFYLRVVKRAQRVSKILFLTREYKSHIFKPTCNVLFIILSQAKNCINTKSHVIRNIFTSEDMENISLSRLLYSIIIMFR
jgi:hypothetical protein